jgi:hypothetical protein
MSSDAHLHSIPGMVDHGHLCGVLALEKFISALTFPFLRRLGYMFSLVPTGEPATGSSTSKSTLLTQSCAFLVILYYDYTLTFSREVEFFWPHRNRIGWVSSIYFLNRYVAIFGYIPIVLRLTPGSDSLFRVRFTHLVDILTLILGRPR